MSNDEQARAALAANPFPANPWVRVTDDAILIKAGYSDTLHRMLRWVPKVEWQPAQRQWRVPLAGAELIRSVLPEISRLAEATHEEVHAPLPVNGKPPAAVEPADSSPVTPHDSPRRVFPANASDEELFRNAARFLFGTDWQRDTARALGREEANLACWLAGLKVAEDDPAVLLNEMLELMRRRSIAITAAANRLAEALETRRASA